MASLIRNADIALDAAIASTKLGAWAAHRSAGGFKLTNLADGVDPGDAVNRAQLDAVAAGAGSAVWGSITGTLSNQTDLQTALNGKVSAISIASANGVSGSSSGGQTPILTIALGAITPSSIVSTGTIAGTNLSGTNSGDQTITLSGDISGTGTGAIATVIGAGKVTVAMMADLPGLTVIGRTSSTTGVPQAIGGADGTILRVVGTTLGFGSISVASINMATNRLLGRSTAGTGAVEEITIGTGLSLSAGTLSSTDVGGTVTSVDVTTANGVSATGGPITGSGSFTFSLGVITPTTVNGLTLMALATGFTIAGGTTSKTLTVPLDASVSGTNTGDQVVPGNTPGVSNQFLSAYNSTTGVFTQTQPSFSNLSGSIAVGQITNGTVTLVKLETIAALSVIGRTVTSGAPVAITGANNQALRITGSVLGFGTLDTAHYGDDSVTFAKMANLTGPVFIGKQTGTGDPEALSVATTQTMLGITGGPFQPLDGDLTAIAGLAAPTGAQSGMIYETPTPDVWARVTVGQGLSFQSGTLRFAIRDSTTPTGTVSAASTLNLTGLTGSGVIEVTGTTNIDAITLADGEQATLRFTGAGLTVTPDASLETPGGVPLSVTTGGQAVITASGGVVTITDYQTATAYSTQTFDNIYMNPGANIGFANISSPYFDVGRVTNGGGPAFGSFLRFNADASPAFRSNDLSVGAVIDISLLSVAGGGSKTFYFPDHSGIFATQDGVESLTNKKLGSLTTNGLIRTSGGDGTLSVDTTVYGTGTVTNFSAGDLSPLFTTSEATASTTPALTFSLSTAAANTFFGNGTGSTAAPTFMSAATAKTALGLDGAVIGPASAGDFNIAIFNGTTGKIIQDSGFPIDSTVTPNTVVLRDGDGNVNLTQAGIGLLFTDTLVTGFVTTVSSGSTIDLDFTSPAQQYVTGTNTNQTLSMPLAASLVAGMGWVIKNKMTGTGQVTITTDGGTTIWVLAPGTGAFVTCVLASGTTVASWSVEYFGASYTTGTKATFPSTSCSVARIDAAQSFTGVQTMTSPALTTPAITGLATGSGVASAATASTLVARDASGHIFGVNLSASGDLIATVAGKGLQLQSGSNARAGNATLVAGTVTVSNTTVDSTKDILLVTRKTAGGTLGMAITYTLSNGASFTINSDNILDTSTLSYMLVRVN